MPSIIPLRISGAEARPGKVFSKGLGFLIVVIITIVNTIFHARGPGSPHRSQKNIDSSPPFGYIFFNFQ